MSTTKHASLNGAKLLIVARWMNTISPPALRAGRRRLCRRRKRGNGHRHYRELRADDHQQKHSVIDAAVVGIVDSPDLNNQ